MERKVVSAIMLTLLLAMSMLTLALNIQSVKADWTWAETIYIRADGSVDPDTAPISTVDNITYTLTDNIVDAATSSYSPRDIAVIIERNNTVLNGAGYTLQGTQAFSSTGISLGGRSNVTIKNINIRDFHDGIYLSRGSNNTVSGNNITANNESGIWLWESSSNTVSGNNITNNNEYGVMLESSSFSTVSGNNITNNSYGVYLGGSNNTVSGNNITNNTHGILLYGSSNTVSGNNITNNWSGIRLYFGSRNNSVHHNNFLYNEGYQIDVWGGYLNTWDDDYPSGGNYWSNYTGVDEKSGPDQDQLGSDGIGDEPHVIDEDNRDRYPLMNPWTPVDHELVVLITAPDSLRVVSSSSLAAIVVNLGLNDEVNVELSLLINGTTADSTTIPLLQAGDSYTLTYLWTPAVEGTHNVTAYARPVSGETSTQNNQKTKLVIVAVSPPPGSPVGVMAGDWIKITYTISGWPAGQPHPEWLKVEFLTVEGTSATVRVTMHMSDETEQSDTVPVDVVAGGQALGLSGFVIPANLTTGDSVFITGYGNVTIEDEATRTYAGASRTVVYASFSQYGTQLTYYWDKRTGVMVEASTTSSGVTATAKATETNMWQAQKFGLPINPTVFYALIIVAIAVVASLAFFMIRRRKKPPEEVEPPKS